MTTAERLIKEGRTEGRTEGRIEGIAEGERRGILKGERRGKRETARAMLKRGLDPKLVTEITGLSIEEIKASPKA